MPDKFYSIREVAARLNVKWYRIKYSHMAGLVPEPMRVGNHRLYAECDVRRLEDYFNMKGGNDKLQHQRQEIPCLEKPEGLCVREHERERLRACLSPSPAGVGT